MTLHERFLCHMKPSTQKAKHNYKFYKAMEEIGKENFYIEEIENNIPISQLDEKEVYYIKKFNSYKNGYNSTNGGKDREINDKQEIEKIIQMYEKGVSSKEIANIYDVSPHTILRTVHDVGYYPQIYPNATKDDLQRYVDEGLSNKEIGMIYHCHPDSIKRYLKKFNIRRRKVYLNHKENFDWNIFYQDIQTMTKEEVCDKYDILESTYLKQLQRIKRSHRGI